MNKLKKLNDFQLFAELIKDPDRKSVIRMISEIVYLIIIRGNFPRHYFSKYLFKKNITNIKDYFPNRFFNKKIKPHFNNKQVREVLENKLFFDLFYRQFNVSLPKILMFNHKRLFLLGVKTVEVTNIDEFKALLEEIFKQNPEYESIFVKKTYWSFGGDRVYKLSPGQITSDPAMIVGLYSEVIKTGFLFQETIIQHPELDKLNPSCLDTLRIDTFIDKDGNIEIISAYIRMSIINNYLDNITSGGCQVGVDLSTGRLKKYGYFTIRSHGAKVITEHPLTKIVFEGFTVPLFEEAKALVIRTAGYMPDLRIIGWDVAISKSGPVIIEGNSNYDIEGNDIAYGGYRTNPVFKKVLQEIKS
jgi:hypothetical protein